MSITYVINTKIHKKKILAVEYKKKIHSCSIFISVYEIGNLSHLAFPLNTYSEMIIDRTEALSSVDCSVIRKNDSVTILTRFSKYFLVSMTNIFTCLYPRIPTDGVI